MSSQTNCAQQNRPPLIALTDEVLTRDRNDRAKENSKWFFNTVRLDQSEQEFDATGIKEIHSFCANVKIKAGEKLISPAFVGFVADIASYQIDARLPDLIAPGLTKLEVIFTALNLNP